MNTIATNKVAMSPLVRMAGLRRVRRRTEPKLITRLLLEISLCIVPAMMLVGIGKPATGAKWFYPAVVVLLGRRLITKDRFAFAAIVIGTIPGLMLFRNFFYYSSVMMFLVMALVLWLFTAPGEVLSMWSNVRVRALVVLGGFYWAVSAYLTGDYSANLRVLELLACVACAYLLVNRWEMMATSLMGICVSVVSMGLAFLPHGERLGAGLIDGYSLGNPISFGLPTTLIFILSIADNGRWLLLQRQHALRILIAVVTGGLLLLSTSRGSWVVVLVNVAILATINRKQRKVLAGLVALLIVVGALLLWSSRGEYVQQSFDRTMSSERSLSSNTSGRSDQWWLFPEVFSDSPLWGFGPGKGAEVYARYSSLYNMFHSGEGMAWHSLYLQIGVETGLIGILAMSLLLIPMIWHGVEHWRTARSSVPLQGTVSFFVIAFSVSGLDAASALFLGLGVLSENWRPTRERLSKPHPVRAKTNSALEGFHVDFENWASGLVATLAGSNQQTALKGLVDGRTKR